MNDTYFTFRSLTAAQRGQAACWKHGIGTKLVRAPRNLSVRGCGYALQVSSGTAEQVSLILRLEQVPFGHVYRQWNNVTEEVDL